MTRLIDLHTHTTASDGTLTPAALVSEASERGVAVLGVTDHDTVDGLQQVEDACRSTNIEFVPGVELSATNQIGEFHILGYFVDQTSDLLRTRLRALAESRVRRVRQMLEKLRDLGYPVDIDLVMSSADNGSIGRPHIGRELIRLGAVSNLNEAFEQFLKGGRPAFVPRERFDPEDAVRLIRDSGALPVLAHPYSTRNPDAAVQRLQPHGLAGIEVWYAAYSEAQRAALFNLAEANGLLSAGGSDYHGPGQREGHELGSVNVPETAYQQLRNKAARA